MKIPLKDGSTVAIIGGGPAGSSCAIKLKREARKEGLDIRVVLFEGKDFEFHYNQCVGVLSPPLEAILEKELGVSLPLDLIRRRIYAYRLHTQGSEVLLMGREEDWPTYTVRRVKFDKFMLEKAEELGAEVVKARVTDLEFVRSGPLDEVRVYSESGYLRADVVVGAFGLDEGMLSVFENATEKGKSYRRPSKFLKTFITKFHTERGFIERKLGNIIYAFLLPLPPIEFGAITPKEDHVIINIAGEEVTSLDMDRFLDLPQVQDHLPCFNREELVYFEGKFPTAPAKNPFGHRFVTVGDATGWMRPFKGKGINTAISTGIEAAKVLLQHGVSREAFEHYARRCQGLLEDYYFGMGVRLFCKAGSRCHLLDPLIEGAKVDLGLYEALYNSVSGQESYKVILQKTLNLRTTKKLGSIIWGQLRPRAGKTRAAEGEAKMGEVTIRRMTPKDIDAILKIDEKITGKPHEAYWESKVASYINRDPASCLVAELEGQVVGFILGDIRGWEFNIPMSGWLEIMGVDPDYQGKGIGRKLAEALFDYFRKSGVDTVHTMLNWNDGDLVDYFRTLGFKRGEFIHLEKKLEP